MVQSALAVAALIAAVVALLVGIEKGFSELAAILGWVATIASQITILIFSNRIE